MRRNIFCMFPTTTGSIWHCLNTNHQSLKPQIFTPSKWTSSQICTATWKSWARTPTRTCPVRPRLSSDFVLWRIYGNLSQTCREWQKSEEWRRQRGRGQRILPAPGFERGLFRAANGEARGIDQPYQSSAIVSKRDVHRRQRQGLDRDKLLDSSSSTSNSCHANASHPVVNQRGWPWPTTARIFANEPSWWVFSLKDFDVCLSPIPTMI